MFRLRSAVVRTRAEAAGRSGFFGHVVHLFSRLRRFKLREEENIFRSILVVKKTMRRQIVQKKTPEEETDTHGQLSEETGDVTSAAGVTLYPCLFPPHRDAHSPPPTTSVTTATTITTTAISPPQTLPTPLFPDTTACAFLAHTIICNLSKENRGEIETYNAATSINTVAIINKRLVI